jgi:hypothetical protein
MDGKIQTCFSSSSVCDLKPTQRRGGGGIRNTCVMPPKRKEKTERKEEEEGGQEFLIFPAHSIFIMCLTLTTLYFSRLLSLALYLYTHR